MDVGPEVQNASQVPLRVKTFSAGRCLVTTSFLVDLGLVGPSATEKAVDKPGKTKGKEGEGKFPLQRLLDGSPAVVQAQKRRRGGRRVKNKLSKLAILEPPLGDGVSVPANRVQAAEAELPLPDIPQQLVFRDQPTFADAKPQAEAALGLLLRPDVFRQPAMLRLLTSANQMFQSFVMGRAAEQRAASPVSESTLTDQAGPDLRGKEGVRSQAWPADHGTTQIAAHPSTACQELGNFGLETSPQPTPHVLDSSEIPGNRPNEPELNRKNGRGPPGQPQDVAMLLEAAEIAKDIAQHTVGFREPADAVEESVITSIAEEDAGESPLPAAEEALQIALNLVVEEEAAGSAQVTHASKANDIGALPAMIEEEPPTAPQAETADFHGSSLTTFEMCRKVQLQKYWLQRYSLWSRFDEGVLMDQEGWYSATPEVLAKHHAERLACDVALDVMCGVGGNAVQLAGTCHQVIASDTNMERLLLAKHNARVYGVSKHLDFVCADFFKLAPHCQADAVFLSPPWGGPSYNSGQGSFSVDEDIGGLGVGFRELLRVADSALHASVLRPNKEASSKAESTGSGIACFLPRASNLIQLSDAVDDGSFCEVERNVLNGRLKSVTVYVTP